MAKADQKSRRRSKRATQLTLIVGKSRQQHAEGINQAHRRATDSFFEVGRLISQAKRDLVHGEFIAMIEADLPFGPRTAQRLMAVAENKVLSNSTHESHLPASGETLYQLTRLPDEILEAKIADGTITPGIERKDVVALRREIEGKPQPPKLPGGVHVDCIQLKEIERGWDDRGLAAAIMQIMMAARRAPDAPKQGVGNPAQASRRTIMELERWVVMLKEGRKETAA